MPDIDTIPDSHADLVEWAKYVKDTQVANEDHNGTDIPPHVNFYREGRLIAMAQGHRVSRDDGLQMARVGITAFGADQVDAIFDAHMTDDRFVETYGRLPDPGELERLCDNEAACEVGLTTDCLMTWRIERQGEPRRRTDRQDRLHTFYASLPYHLDRRQKDGETVKTCHWQDDRISVYDDAKEGEGIMGIVPDGLREPFTIPSAWEAMAAAGIDWHELEATEDLARLQLDLVTARILMGLGFSVGLAAHDEQAVEIIREVFDSLQDKEPSATDGLLMLQRMKREGFVHGVLEADEAEVARRQKLRVDGKPSDEDVERLAGTRAAMRNLAGRPEQN